MDAIFTIKLIDWQLELDHRVTEFYMNTNYVFIPVDWQLELDQHDANVAIGPIDWQLEFDQVSLIFTWTPTLPSDPSTGN